MDLQNLQTDSDAYFIDHCYYQQYPHRLSYTRNPRSNFYIKVYPRRRTSQKCFVCGKEGYQSTRYTQEEYNKSRKRLNSYINQFILEYKGEKAEKPPNKLIEVFIINFNSNAQEQETLKIFLITFRPFIDSQAFNITTVLTNHSFIHLIAPENHSINTSITDITDHKQDLFAYITTECYTPKKFYSVIIDTGAFKKSTIDYG